MRHPMGATLNRLPTARDGEAGLEQLRVKFGNHNLYQHIRWVRDSTTQPDVVHRMMERLAAATLARVEATRRQLTDDEARRAAAARLGFEGTNRTNLYKRYLTPGRMPIYGEKPLKWHGPPAAGVRRYLAALPVAADGEDGLRALADAFGTEPVFNYLRYLRDNRPQAPTVGRFQQQLAVQMLQDLREERPELDDLAARQTLAAQLGYSKTSRVYLYTILRAGEELLADHYA